MPDGKTHTAATIRGTLAAVPALILQGQPANLVLYMALGSLSNILLSPDLDLDEGYIGIHMIRTYFGDLPAWIWQMIWKPYARLMPHRSVRSHFPVISTAIRLGYIYFIYQAVFQTINVFLFFVARGNSIPVYQIPMQEIWSSIVHPFGVWTVRSVNAFSYFCGLCFADTLHALMDVVSTNFKHFRRNIGSLSFPLSEMRPGHRGGARDDGAAPKTAQQRMQREVGTGVQFATGDLPRGRLLYY